MKNGHARFAAILTCLLPFCLWTVRADAAPLSARCESNLLPEGRASLHVVILIDRTFQPSPGAVQWVTEAAHWLIGRESTVLQIAGFSQSAAGASAPTFGAPLIPSASISAEEERNLRRSELALRQRCAAEHQAALQQEVNESLQQNIGVEVQAATHTEIATTFGLISPAFVGITANRNVLIVLSDGYEHNTDQSFYRNRKPRLINPDQELMILQRRGLGRPLTGVDVIWLGLGTAAEAVPWQIYGPLHEYWTRAGIMLGGNPMDLSATPALPLAMLLEIKPQRTPPN